MDSFGSRVRDVVLSVEAFDSVSDLFLIAALKLLRIFNPARQSGNMWHMED